MKTQSVRQRADSKAPAVSVIVPARGGQETLERCLAALAHQEGLGAGYEVIVVDDGSQGSLETVAADHGARCVRQKPLGPAAARNAGARAARGEILAFTDSDCAARAGWLAELTKPFKDPQVVGVKGTYTSEQRAWTPRFVQQEYQAKYRRMAARETIDFVDTYSAAYRREVFLENGGFDAAFPIPSVEDQELSFRLARKGYRMVFAPQAVVEHFHDRSPAEYLRRKFNIGYWKAFMLGWLPEKLFSDSHTLPAQRWQIVLLGLSLGGFLLATFWRPGLLLGLTALALFFLIDAPFLVRLVRGDMRWIVVAPGMLILRAGALGAGLAAGFLVPPRARPKVAGGLSPLQRGVKRAIDLIGAGVGLLLSLPIVLAAAVAIVLEDGRPVLFRQRRIGEGGAPFVMVKLRTMRRGAEELVGEVMAQNPLEGPVYKIPHDPRVTKTGRFLRRWSLDEIPQLWNVLKGEMSLVGPRPEEEWVVDQYDDTQRLRLGAKPGLTGPMQVNGRGDLNMDERLALELEYIREYSLKKDIVILLKTLPAVARAEGTY